MVVIAAEPLLESRLTTEFRQLGATAFSIVDGRGEGSRHAHATDLPGANIRIEAIVPPAVADRIMDHIAQHYFTHFSFIAYVLAVAVGRGAKYQ